MADIGGGHAGNGAGANRANHALAVAAANGGDHTQVMAAENGPVENGGNHAAANGAVANGATDNGGNPAHALAVVAGAVAPALRMIPEQALYNVLLRLPAAVIARCRTLCRLWRDVPVTQAFREEHRYDDHGRYMPLFFYRLDHQAVPLDDYHRVNLRAVDIRDRASLPVMRFAHLDAAHQPSVDPHVLRIEGSCDGILLLSYDTRLYACNPCTRRWARLPQLHDVGDIVGFYPHGPLDRREYRVLFHMDAGRRNLDFRYWVMALSSPEHPVRYIGRPANLEAVQLLLARGISPSFLLPPVLVDDSLYWLPQVHQDNRYLLIFNTVDELFRWIPPPMVGEIQVRGDQLLQINGRLAMTLVCPTSIEVWLLHHNLYIGETWVWTYQIQLPEAAIRYHHGYMVENLSAVTFVVSEQSVLVQCPRALLQCDAIGTLLQSYQLAHNRTILSRHMLQESLILYTFLPLRPSDANVRDPPFFQAP
jgi:F-box interacting protein